MGTSNIALNIQRLCAEKNISVNKLATETGITQSTIDSILKGKSNNPRIDTIIKISDYFNVPINELLGLDESNKITIEIKYHIIDAPPNEPDVEIIKVTDTPERLRRILELIENWNRS